MISNFNLRPCIAQEKRLNDELRRSRFRSLPLSTDPELSSLCERLVAQATGGGGDAATHRFLLVRNDLTHIVYGKVGVPIINLKP